MEPVRNPLGVVVALQSACQAHPEQRVMQVITNALSQENLGPDPFYVEDNDAIRLLDAYARAATRWV